MNLLRLLELMGATMVPPSVADLNVASRVFGPSEEMPSLCRSRADLSKLRSVSDAYRKAAS